MTAPEPGMAGGAATRASRTLRGIGIALVVCILAACARNEAPAADAWRDWLGRDNHAAEVAAYAAYLRTEGVEAVVPMPELLRTSRRWRDCGHDAWAVPPRALWPRIVPTLRLIARIETDTGLRLDAARSGWRSETVNRCAGGAARSRHLQNVALDIDLPASLPSPVGTATDAGGNDSPLTRLCGFWRRHGAQTAMGLGFYTPTRIHIDTAGRRTWGSDHRRGTSLCVR